MEEMEVRQKPKKRRTFWRKISRWRPGKKGSIFILALLVVVTVAIIGNLDRITIGHFNRAIQYSRLGSPGHAAEFRFANLGSNTFVTLGDGIAVASTGGLRFYDRSGTLAYAEAFEMEEPVIRSTGDYVLAYDLGGVSFQSGNRHGALVRMNEWEGRIIDANINANGWIIVSSEEIGNLGRITVFDAQGVRRWHVAIGTDSGHVIGAVLANDNRTVAVLTMTDQGGRVHWITTAADGTTQANYYYLREGEVFFDIWTRSNSGDVGVISSNTILYLTSQGEVESEYHFQDRHLRAYDIADGRAALYLSTSQTGSGGEIVILDQNGHDQSVEISGNLLDISLRGRFVAALFVDELLIFRGTSNYARWRETEGMSSVLMREDGTVFRLSQHRARLLVP